jgi:PAS domain S-box-containing protein
MMNQPLRVLIVEDSEDDMILLLHTLRRGGYAVASNVVDTAAAMRKALESSDWDIITSDHAMPHFSAPEALALARELRPEVPFLIVSGEIDLNLGVSLMRGGAKDYIQKRELARLVPAVERVLREVALRRERQRDEAALRENEKLHHTILQTAMDGFWMVDLEGHLLEVNEAYCRMSGYNKAELLTMQIADLEYGVSLDKIADRIQTIVRQGQDRFETRHRRKDGSLFDLEVSVQYRVEEGGRLVEFLRDITERKSAEIALQESEEKYRSLIESSSDSIFCVDHKGEYQFTNHQFAATFGKTPDYFVGKTFWDIYSLEHADSRYKITTQVFQTGESLSFEITVPVGGKSLYFYSTASPLKDETGKVKAVLVFAKDITHRKQAEEALSASENRFRTLLQDISTVAVQGYGMDGKTQYWNTASERVYGYSAQEAIGQNLLDLIIPPEMRSGVRQAIQQMAETGQPTAAEELSLMRKDGTRVSVFSSHVIVAGPGGAPELFCLDVDLTGHKQTEQALCENEARYRLIAENSADVIWVLNLLTGKFTYVSPSVIKLRGFTPAEAMTQKLADVLKPESVGIVMELLRRRLDAFRAGDTSLRVTTEEVDQIRKDGTAVATEVSTTLVGDAQGNPVEIVGVSRDITERRRAEEEVRNSEKRFLALLRNGRDNISLLAADGTLLWENPSTNSMLGYRPNQFIGHNIFELMHPEDQTWTGEMYAQVVQQAGSMQEGVFRLLHADGTWRWIECSISNLLDDPWVRAIVLNYHDITARKEAEEQLLRLNAELEQRVTECTAQLAAANKEL